jgi:hypothetical protein
MIILVLEDYCSESVNFCLHSCTDLHVSNWGFFIA